MTAILGLSFDYHDAAAALIVDGEVLAAAEEERFTRVKHDPGLPRHAMEWCLDASGVRPGDLTAVAFHSKPLTTYERILSSHAKAGPKAFSGLRRAVSNWSRSKLWVRERIDAALDELGHGGCPVSFVEHHLGHAASAFHPSPHESAAILTFDGVGEWVTTSIARGHGSRIEMLVELAYPDSIGLLYSAMTAFCGFEVNEGEYKLMGLAPYGEPTFVEVMRERLVQVADDGSVRLDLTMFDFCSGRRMTTPALDALLGGPPRRPGEPLGQREADIARSTQVLLEDVVLRIARHAHRLTREPNACLAGGVALNCVANGVLLDRGPFESVWVQPAGGDAGGALGSALWVWHHVQGGARSARPTDGMSGSLLGPSYGQKEVAGWLHGAGLVHEEVDDHDELVAVVADELAAGRLVGWFQGRMEFGPRALGNRSILADPRAADVVERLNRSVKQREDFRPFAPAVLEEHAEDWFDLDRPSPYMLFTRRVRSAAGADGRARGRAFAERLHGVRSAIPACTHVDGSARVQTVSAMTNPAFHALLSAFLERTGCPVLLNTSFNGPGEPIVRTPADALRCATRIGLDLLVIERSVVRLSPAQGVRAA